MLKNISKIVLALTLVVSSFAPAYADCIASAWNGVAVAQLGDAISTNGPVLYKFPGGFVTQNQGLKCDSPVSPNPGAPLCPYTEGDQVAYRAGCVKAISTDVACVTFTNFLGRELTYALTPKNATQKSRNRVCNIIRAFSVVYAGVIWPSNWHADHDIRYTQLAKSKPAVHLNFVTLRF